VTRAAARFAAVLDLPPDAEIGRTASLEDATPIPEIGPILDQLAVRSPVLRALDARIEAAERRSRAARLAGYPDVDLGIGYRIRDDVTGDPVNGEDFLSAGVTIRLPVDRSRWRGEVAEARAEVRRWRAEHRAVRRDLEARARAAHAELVRADAQARLIRSGLLPQAEQSLASTRSAYEVGRVDILGLLDSQVRLLDAQLEHVRALADRRVAYANLELIHGESLR
jgi:outer membrane protein TolC